VIGRLAVWLIAAAAPLAALADAAAVVDPRSAAQVASPARLALLERGEAALARGDAPAAIDAFEQAATMLHSVRHSECTRTSTGGR
jgi:hypothetical protein